MIHGSHLLIFLFEKFLGNFVAVRRRDLPGNPNVSVSAHRSDDWDSRRLRPGLEGIVRPGELEPAFDKGCKSMKEKGPLYFYRSTVVQKVWNFRYYCFSIQSQMYDFCTKCTILASKCLRKEKNSAAKSFSNEICCAKKRVRQFRLYLK